MLVKLNEVCDIIPGFAFKGSDFNESGAPVVKITDINPPNVNTLTCSHVDLANYNVEKLKKYIISKGDYILAMTGATIGKLGKVCSGKAYINQRVAKFVANENINSKYLYYILSTNDFLSFIMNNVDSNSAQPNISANSIGRYTFNCHSKDDQLHIVNILGSLDEKIENIDRKIQKNKDLMQVLFIKYQNDCQPNYTLKLGEVITFIKGKKPFEDNKSLLPYLNIESMENQTFEKKCSVNMVIANENDLLMVMDGASSGTVYSGYNGIVGSTLSKIKIEPPKLTTIIEQKLIEMCSKIKELNTGSAIPHANKEFVFSIELKLGDEKMTNNLIKELTILKGKIKENQNEKNLLTRLKSLYLKKFFS